MLGMVSVITPDIFLIYLSLGRISFIGLSFRLNNSNFNKVLGKKSIYFGAYLNEFNNTNRNPLKYHDSSYKIIVEVVNYYNTGGKIHQIKILFNTIKPI